MLFQFSLLGLLLMRGCPDDVLLFSGHEENLTETYFCHPIQFQAVSLRRREASSGNRR